MEHETSLLCQFQVSVKVKRRPEMRSFATLCAVNNEDASQKIYVYHPQNPNFGF